MPASIAEFGLTTGTSPTYITSGPNGNLWFTEPGVNKIGEITTSGTVTEFALTGGSNPQGITTGPNGNLWFTEFGTNKIGEITTGGSITEFALTTGSHPQAITTGSNGNLWFTENGTNKIAEIVPSGAFAGTITEFALAAGSQPYGITSGPNGNLWFTEHGANKVGQIVPSGTFAGTVNTYSLSNGAGPEGITTGSDGNLWFAENGGSNIGQVSLGGSVVEYSIPGTNGSPQQIVSGPLGDLYFTESTGNNIIQLTTQGQFTDYAVPTSGADGFGITQGPDNHIWFAENVASQIGRLNLNPIAVNDTYTAAESTVANPASLVVSSANGVLTNDTDPESDSLAVLFASTGNRGTNHGTVTLNSNGSFTYTPTNGFIGTDSFGYQATDGQDSSNTVTVTINVDAPPVAVADNYTTLVSTTLTVSNVGLGVLANDTDPNGGHTLSATATQPSHGTLTLNANGTFTYIPTAGYHGTDSFTYFDTDSDGVSVSNTATVTIVVDTPPVAVNDSYTAIKNTALIKNAATGVLANDTDADGNPLTAVLITGPTHGTLTLNADGSFTYTPTAGYTGTDSFTYKANDGFTNGNTATVNLTVDTPPVAVNDSYSTTENIALSKNAATGVLFNDTDAESNPLTAVLITGPTHGTLTLNANGSFLYTSNTNYSGADSFTYAANDGTTNGNTATVSLTIIPAPTLTVTVFRDYNANGIQDSGEVGLAGMTVYLDLNSNGQFDTGEPSAVTDASGNVTFAHLAAGTYLVRQDLSATPGVALTNGSAAGLSVLVSGSTTTAALGDLLYSLDAPVSSITQIYGTNNPNNNTAYVTGLYSTLLGRAADAADMAHWVGQLNGTTTRAQVVQAFLNSPEYRGQEVDAYYQKFLHRAAGPTEQTYWVNQFLGGAQEAAVQQGILASSEFQSAHADNASFVQELYLDLLNRTPDAAGEANWLKLLNGGTSRASVITGFQRSEELGARAVDGFYAAYLHRATDTAGSYWLNMWMSGARQSDIVAGFLNSAEFFNNGAATVG